MALDLTIIEGVHIVTGQPVFEVVDDVWFKHRAYFSTREKAENYIRKHREHIENAEAN